MQEAKSLMLVNNSLGYDSRVNRSFETVASAGYAVDLYGVGNERSVHPNGGVTIARNQLLRTLLSEHAAFRKAALVQKPKLFLRLMRGYLRLFTKIRIRGIVAFGFVGFSVLWNLRRHVLNRHFVVMLEDAILLANEIRWWKYEIVHIHDARLLPFARMAQTWSTVKSRALRRRVPTVQIIYDVHESVAGQTHLYGTASEFMSLLEKMYSTKVTHFSYVCDELADLHLERKIRRKSDQYSVIFSYPSLSVLKPLSSLATPPKRKKPLVVYSGLLSSFRGVETIVQAQAYCDFDLRVIHAEHQAAYVAELRILSDSVSAKGSFSAHPFVTRSELQELLAEADLGVIPILRRMPDTGEIIENHEIALTNKLFEYITAGLPVVVSDCKAQADFVRSHEIGAVFSSGDPKSFADSFASLLPRINQTRERVASVSPTFIWETQTEQVLRPYRVILAR